MKKISGKLEDLFKKYAKLELHIQKIINRSTGRFCSDCTARCCKEHFCKESIESPFLAALIKKQKMIYHTEKGWMGPKGCRLAYGRPLVCYDFFCDAVSDSPSFQATDIKTIVREFISIGNKVSGNTHLICIDNVETMSSIKIDAMLQKIDSLTIKIRPVPSTRDQFETKAAAYPSPKMAVVDRGVAATLPVMLRFSPPSP
jgi:hypothetical protein